MNAAVSVLTEYRLVRGDESGNLNLQSPVTRAEMAAVLVRARGLESRALTSAPGTGGFTDTVGHWATGYIATARGESLIKGYPDGSFRPNQPLTYPEALAMALRLIGQEPLVGPWPGAVLERSVALGLVPSGTNLGLLAQAVAPRQDLFYSLYRAVATVAMDTAGTTALKRYLDQTPPVVSPDPLPATTDASRVTVSGRTDARVLTVNGQQALVSGGIFRVDVPVGAGFNQLVIQALDAAGNRTTVEQTVVGMPAVVGPGTSPGTAPTSVARLDITGPTQVPVGSQARYSIVAYDLSGRVVSPGSGVTARIEGSIGSFDPATGTFTATSPGRGSIIMSAGGVSQTFNVEVLSAGTTPSAAVSLRIKAPANVPPGQRVELTVEVVDAQGNLVSSDHGRPVTVGASGANWATLVGTATTVGGVAGFTHPNPGAGTATFTATAPGLTTGAATVAFTAGAAQVATALRIGGADTIPLGRTGTVTVSVVDGEGNVVTADHNRLINLSATGLTGATVNGSGRTSAGVANFTVAGTAAGLATLSATASGLASASGTLLFGTEKKITLVATPDELTADGASTSVVEARLLDAGGRAATNQDEEDIEVELTLSGPGFLEEARVVIPVGENMGRVTYTAATIQGTATISGGILSGTAYAVTSATVKLGSPPRGQPVALQVATVTRVKEPGDEVPVQVQVVDRDGRVATTGSYAFQLKVETSNTEDDRNDGMPSDLQLWLGDADDVVPVDDENISSADDVVARTVSGTATIKLIYPKSGIITLTPVLRAATEEAYDGNGEKDTASSSKGLSARAGTVTYAGEPVGLKVRIDSNLGKDKISGAVSTSGASTATVRAYVVDADDAWVPNTRYAVTLTRITDEVDAVTRMPTTGLTARTVNGKAEWVVRGSTTTGIDTYLVESSALGSSDQFDITVHGSAPPKPTILAARGVSADGPGQLNYVAPDDEGLELELSFTAASSRYPLVAVVYREGSSTPIYTSDPLDEDDEAPKVEVPKQDLPSGEYGYQVSLRNGSGESSKSTASAKVTNNTLLSSTAISSAKYNGDTQVLTVTASGISSTGTIDTSALALRIIVGENDEDSDEADDITIALEGLDASISKSTQFTVDLSGLAAPDQADLFLPTGDLDIDMVYDGVFLDAARGWYVKANGDEAPADDDNPVTPFARITHAVYNPSTKKLHLYGERFDKGSLVGGSLTVSDGDSSLTLSNLRGSRVDSNEYTVTLSTSAHNTLLNMGADITLEGTAGWFKDGTTGKAAAIDSVPVFFRVAATSANYSRQSASSNPQTLTIKGSGFTGGAVLPELLTMVDLSTGAELPLSTESTATVVSDSTVRIVLTDEEAAALEDAGDFSGTDIYVRAGGGWFTDEDSHPAQPITGRTIRLPQP